MHRWLVVGLVSSVAAALATLAGLPGRPLHAVAHAAQIRPILAPHPDGPIWGAVDPAVLGECPAEAHDAHVVAGGDGFRYRTWHPQVDPTGCVYAH